VQIREISLKELFEVYELVKTVYALSYEEFEDLIYEMRETYTMIGVFEKQELLAFAGVSIVTTLKDARHLRVYDFVAKDEKTKKELHEYLLDYQKISAAKKVIYE
jgi:hypothetical protein